MRKRGRPNDAVTVDDLKAWAELEADTILGRLEQVPTEERRRWMRRQFNTSAQRFADRRERWQLTVAAADVVDEVVDVLTKVDLGEIKFDWQRALIERAFVDRRFATPRAKYLSITPAQVQAAGGRTKWATSLVAAVTGISGYALREQRLHRARVESEVIDTLRTPVEHDDGSCANYVDPDDDRYDDVDDDEFVVVAEVVEKVPDNVIWVGGRR